MAKVKLNRVQFGTAGLAAWLGVGHSPDDGFPLTEALSRLVLRIDHERWGQTLADLRRLALTTPHARSRERFLALHDIAQGGGATAVAERTGHRPQTVMGWLHSYNEHGPEALLYRRTGGRPLFARTSQPRSAQRSARPSKKRPRRPSPAPTRNPAGR